MTPPDRSLPLSSAQERLWFFDRMHPGSVVYNVPIVFWLRGTLDTTALQAALDEVVARHEILRTRFTTVEGRPVQTIDPHPNLSWTTHDLTTTPTPTHDPTHDPRQTALAHAHDLARIPFDLSTGPLLRPCLLRTGPHEHLIAITVHHIVFDAWSLEIFTRELAHAYTTHTTTPGRRPTPLPPLPLQYADYAAWQRQQLTGGHLDDHLAYWRTHLTDAPLALNLPTDHPRPRTRTRTHTGGYQTITLPRHLTTALRTLCTDNGVTPFMATLAVYAALLSRYTGQTDILIGTPIANRPHPHLQPLIGFFVNTLPIRIDLTDDPTTTELLQHIRTTTINAYAHQDLPFEQLVRDLRPKRDPTRPPLTEVLFSLYHGSADADTFAGLAVEQVAMHPGAAEFDLSLILRQSGDDVIGQLEYRADLFETQTARRMLAHYVTLAESMAATPHARLSQMRLLTERERYQLVTEWNPPSPARPAALADACLHELVEAQADLTPESVAVSFGRNSLTYRQLDDHANRLAWWLREQGVAPGVPVGVCLERSVELSAAVIAVLKAGGAYVPMDPSHPPERNRAIAENAGIQVVLTQDHLAGTFTDCSRVFRTDRDWLQLSQDSRFPTRRPERLSAPDDLAYIIYTSGSTGAPKGVMVRHRSVVNLVHALMTDLGITSKDRVLAVTTVSFDVAGADYFVPLSAGASVVIAARETIIDGTALAALLRSSDVTMMQATPSLCRMLLDSGWPGDPALQLVCGGEALSAELADRLVIRAGRLWNGYGPTESTVYSLTALVQPGDTAPVPIGRPIANTRVYVVDQRLDVVPVGVPGELLIGGDGVALGYLGLPGLTAERFIPDPFSGRPGDRLYRTGDVVRYRPDGVIDFLGRIDHQVKIRGFRIEPGEIESALAKQPGVKECVVVLDASSTGDARLVAYLTGNGGPDSSLRLRTALRDRLPDYMVPAAFVWLDVLPLNGNGKIDRSALRPPEHDRSALNNPFTPPRDPFEQLLTELYGDILSLPPADVGIHDDFFTLGGHSLLATRLASRASSVLSVDLTPADIFERPTVAELAELARNGRNRPLPAAIHPVPRNRSLPLSSAQERLWFFDRMHPGSVVYNVPIVFWLRGTLDTTALQAALDEVVARHEILRTRFTTVEGRPVQTIDPHPNLSWTTHDLTTTPTPTHDPTHDPRQTALDHAHDLARIPFDLSTGPLLRPCLLRTGPHEHLIAITVHHIVFDAWSLEIFTRELAHAYTTHTTTPGRRPTPLPPLPLQYADYAAWQRQQLTGGHLDDHLAYWRTHLTDAPLALNLPTDHPRPRTRTRTHTGGYQTITLPRHHTTALRTLCTDNGVTPFMATLAVYAALLSRYTGQTDILIGTPIANRPHPHLQPLIGFFVNTLPIRIDLTDDPTTTELLQHIRTTTINAYAHQDLPFEQLVRDLRPKRDPTRPPLVQAMFAFAHRRGHALEFPVLVAEPVDLPPRLSRFDLSLMLEEEGNQISGGLLYDSSLFEGVTIQRASDDYVALATLMARRPDRRLSEVFPDLASAEEGSIT
ncbi:non-ribosomal peptide synthetase [Microbispora sp. H10670]|uniref:non-ribosomal peptide synthetase n=1 Tax=Microbispora sp. H10670 TaxID=2729108 RepID=UPI0015FF9D1B|nr:non-ribosomal peptide synthetase [Microbispora sp. H10670]